jgi:hypothetical protein
MQLCLHSDPLIHYSWRRACKIRVPRTTVKASRHLIVSNKLNLRREATGLLLRVTSVGKLENPPFLVSWFRSKSEVWAYRQEKKKRWNTDGRLIILTANTGPFQGMKMFFLEKGEVRKTLYAVRTKVSADYGSKLKKESFCFIKIISYWRHTAVLHTPTHTLCAGIASCSHVRSFDHYDLPPQLISDTWLSGVSLVRG